MRDLGYSLETAVADLIDNSISAGADAIEIIFDASSRMPVVVILDNGGGMTKTELLAAMRHGATNPHRPRSAVDLGRFGLGLKTASFSQCRSLTVVSVKEGEWCGAEWNLDRIDEADDWILAVLSKSDINALPYVDRLGAHGTAVVWRELDRLVEGDTSAPADQVVNEKIELVARHLSLVFHRFLSGEARGFPKVAISINGRSIAAFDPFCRKNLATQMLPEEKVRVNGEVVRLQPYILPHHSRLSATEFDHYRDRSDFLSNQGVYVYRNSRLMAWGGWFRLVPKGEATKLARVQIDFPHSLDEAWTIDIKKSRAHPPWRVRERLRQIIEKIAQRSVDVHRKRGAKRFSETTAPFWERYAGHSGVRYELNHEHPLVLSLARLLPPDSSKLFDLLLDAIAAALPAEMIYSDYSTNPGKVEHRPVDKDATLLRLQELHRVLCGDGPVDPKAFREVVRSTHLFDDNDELVEQFIRGAY